jgi:Mce-associated membrane protein
MDLTPDRTAGAVSVPAGPQARTTSAIAYVLLVVIASLAWVGYDGLAAMRDGESLDATRAQVVDIASEKVLVLTRFSDKTSERDTRRLLEGVTDEFRDSYRTQIEAFGAAVTRDRVTATGTIASAGVKSLEGDTALVLVAATRTVQNKRTDKPEPRYYRLLVELKRAGGGWLVNGLEFVA